MKTHNTRNMKKFLLLVVLICGMSSWCLAQNITTDLVVLDPSCINFAQLQAQYQGQPNLLVLAASQVDPLQQIASALSGKNLANLHIFVLGKPGSMVFSMLTVNTDNISDYSNPLGQWAAHLSGNVVIHNSNVFAAEAGQNLKTAFQQLTGLTFVAQ